MSYIPVSNVLNCKFWLPLEKITMKKISIIFFVLFQTFVFACKCDQPGKVGIQFQEADFVGEIEILNITAKKKSRSYIAEVSVAHVYKGREINRIEVLGKVGDIQSGACEVELKVGEKYLIYLSEAGGENIWSMTSSGKVNLTQKYVVSGCTPKTLITNGSKYLETERKLLDYLRQNSLKHPQAFYFDNSKDNGPGAFKKFELTEPKNLFAIFKLKVNNKSEVENVTAVQNFGSTEDEELLKLIKTNFIIIKDFMTEVRNEEVVVTLFYIPENASNEFEDTITIALPDQQLNE